MRLSEGVEWTVHCCTLLATIPPDVCLPGSRLAEYHGVPGPYLTKHLQALTRAGILESVPGPKGGFRLARPARDITMLEIVEAIDGSEPAFTCTEIRRRGPAGGFPARHYPMPCGIHVVMDRADAAWRAELAATTIYDLALHVAAAVTPAAAMKAATWFQEVTIRRRKSA
jgi:Rrf2 family protein